jgi:predicted ABC-type transport system involved in lysophospholipase L1 biosynthesis ATPase subunit
LKRDAAQYLDPALASRCGRVLEMQDGRIVRDSGA